MRPITVGAVGVVYNVATGGELCVDYDGDPRLTELSRKGEASLLA